MTLTALGRMAAIVRTYGFSISNMELHEGALWEIDTPEASFLNTGDGVAVVMWTGSYPFAHDHDMGTLPSIEEAVRYAVWLLKREARYDAIMDEAWTEGAIIQ